MKRAISYALFGYNKPQKANCFTPDSYLRGMMINIRMNRLLYPDWVNVIHVDKSTYEPFKDLFDNIPNTEVVICDDAPLCLAMLWRMKPIFEQENGHWKYSHVICRDLDSPATFREVQAVWQWIQDNTAVHAICDSVSHNIPMMGGMIGARPDYFTMRTAQTWNEMIELNPSFNFERKGSDQDFLTKVIYPRFAQPGNDSITQHYVLGYGNTFLQKYRNHIPNIATGLPEDLEESNNVCGHIGSAGAYTSAIEKFLADRKDKFLDIHEIEKPYSDMFYWATKHLF